MSDLRAWLSLAEQIPDHLDWSDLDWFQIGVVRLQIQHDATPPSVGDRLLARYQRAVDNDVGTWCIA